MGTQILTGIGGAIGADHSVATNQYVFTEFAGKLSRYNLLRPFTGTVSQGTTVLRGTFSFDLDLGATASGSTADIFWEQFTAVRRGMVPVNGARIVNLGPVPFSTLDSNALQNLAFGETPIVGDNDASNRLVAGDVFAVLTSAGNYAKVKIITYGYDLTIQWKTYRVGPKYEVLGTGYDQPEDVVLSEDGMSAWVTERVGTLLRVSLGAANRSSATVLASGLTAPHQIAIDEPRGLAWVVEYANPGRLLRIPLAGGTPVAVVSNLENAIGLLVDGDNAYVTEQAASGGRLTRIHMPSGQRQSISTGLVNPFFLDWGDAGRTSILVPERDPANRVKLVDISVSPPLEVSLGAVPMRPSSATPIGRNRIVVACNEELHLLDLVDSSASGPFFLGIGYVPVTSIDDATGLATTAASYFFQVKDAPFGGTLSLNINHDGAYAMGGVHYKVKVDGVEHRGDFVDYKWVASNHAFEPTSVIANSTGFYKIRRPSELWYNHFLGLRLDTTGLANGLHNISVHLYDASYLEIAAGSIQSRHVRIDNTWPQASIDAILHEGVAVNKCGIVRSGSDSFQFQITAHDAQGNLLSWRLSALWGDNQSVAIDSASYPASSPTPLWTGLVGVLVPAAGWASTKGMAAHLPIGPSNPVDPYSHWCAHTFHLDVWDRTIDGSNRIHHSVYTKSITIMLPPIPPAG
ncbi:MAG: hypothetical protein IPO40_15570 [Fibrobacteres bacterium]|nr:hypothetical protein [Fibrobacterota bacterium]